MSKYYYHCTTLDRIPSIMENGLLPSRLVKGHDKINYEYSNSKYIYLASTPKDAFGWSNDILEQNEWRPDKYKILNRYPILLRIPKSKVGKVKPDPYFKNLPVDDAFVTEQPILPDDIEIATDMMAPNVPDFDTRVNNPQSYDLTDPDSYVTKIWRPLSTFDPINYRAFTKLSSPYEVRYSTPIRRAQNRANST